MKKIYKYIVILVILVTITLFALSYFRGYVTQRDKERYESLIDQGDKDFERREYALALGKYSEATEIIPTNRVGYSKVIELLALKKRYEDAKDIVEQSGKALSNSNRAKLYLQLSHAYYDGGIYDKALEFVKESLKLSGSDDANLLLSKVHLKLGSTSDSVKALEKIKGNEGDVALERDLLLAYLYKLDTQKASALLGSRDLTLEGNKDVVESIKSYLKVLGDLDSDELYTRASLAGEYINSGFPILAVEVLESEVEKMAEYPDGLYFLARAYFDLGKYSSSLDILNRASAFDAYASEVYLLKARATLVNGDNNQAFQAYEKAIEFELNSAKADIYKEYIGILMSERAYSEVKSNLDKVISDSLTDDIWPVVTRIELLYNQKNFVEMEKALSTLSKDTSMTDVEKAEYLKWHIVYDIENDKLASAKENLATLRGLDRYNPNFYLLSGRVHLIENNQDASKEDLNRAINYDLDGKVTEDAKRLLGRIE